jgi:hypothetical protein
MRQAIINENQDLVTAKNVLLQRSRSSSSTSKFTGDG